MTCFTSQLNHIRKSVIPHELGHMIMLLSLTRDLKFFGGLDITISHGRCYHEDIKKIFKNNFKLEDVCVLYAGAVAEKIFKKNKNIVVLSSPDKSKILEYKLTRAENSLCKKRTEEVLQEHKELLFFLTWKIYKIAIKENLKVRITTEVMRELLLEFYKDKESTLLDSFDIIPSNEINLPSLEELEEEEQKKKEEFIRKLEEGLQDGETLPF